MSLQMWARGHAMAIRKYHHHRLHVPPIANGEPQTLGYSIAECEKRVRNRFLEAKKGMRRLSTAFSAAEQVRLP